MESAKPRRFAFRLVAAALAVVRWPVEVATRLTQDGFLFLILALACGVLSFSSSTWSNIPLLLCLVLISLWLLAMWQGRRSLQQISVKRSHVERIFANENLSVSLSLTNASVWPCTGLVISEQLENDDSPAASPSVPRQTTEAVPARTTPARVPAAYGGTFVTVVAGRGQERVKYSLMLRRRGIYRFTDTVIQTEAPLGFFKSSVVRRSAGRLVVYPRLGEVDASFFKELDMALDHIRRSKPSRAEEDFRGLREYRKGDNPKWIHWKSSARSQKTLVKEFEEPQARRVLLILDTNLQRVGVQRFAAFETALSFAATVARDLARRGCEVECAALQPREKVARATISRERRNLDTLLEMLAALKRDDRRNLTALSAVLERRSLHRAYVLVLGLGSLRAKASLAWLNTGDNGVRVIDVRSDDFRRIFHRTTSGAAREDIDDELLVGLDEEEAAEEPALAAGE
ncbi:MAG TPA: DUF58 domain-containing protein [Planctomycetota bacterium]|nr:DUF58 domain-containing protein [Planctomycetota bacterium]